MANNNSQAQQMRSITPLWVISLFLSLTETITGIAVIKATGNVQIALTAFVILFPTLVATVFFLILWSRPYVLYPPKEFGETTDVSKYVEAMQRRAVYDSNIYDNFKQTLHSTITSDTIASEIMNLVKSNNKIETKQQISNVLEKLANTAATDIEQSFISVETSQITKSKTKVTKIPYFPSQEMGDLLDSIWALLDYKVPPATYGQAWVLKEADTGFVIPEGGSPWAKAHGKLRDTRPISELGIRAGMQFEAVRLKEM
jgi:hypothetical protein